MRRCSSGHCGYCSACVPGKWQIGLGFIAEGEGKARRTLRLKGVLGIEWDRTRGSAGVVDGAS
jgi:hypothetical protein